MFKDTIEGLGDIFTKDIVPPMIVIVRGPPGSMKTTFVHMLMSRYLAKKDEFGLYTTLEESVRSHLRTIKSIGMEISLNMQISDFSELRKSQGDNIDKIDYLGFTEDLIKHFKGIYKDKFTVFAFDSLGALYSLLRGVESPQIVRKKIYHFFEMLRDNGLIAFIIMESALDGESKLLGDEGFLSDGVIMLGLKRKQGKLIRYLQVEKMRAVRHSMEMHAVEIRNAEFMVLGPIYED